MVELPKREQSSASFDMLYTLANKMEAISLCIHAGGSKGLPMPIKTSTGDTLLLQDGW